jgi:hypothetical protein
MWSVLFLLLIARAGLKTGNPACQSGTPLAYCYSPGDFLVHPARLLAGRLLEGFSPDKQRILRSRSNTRDDRRVSKQLRC